MAVPIEFMEDVAESPNLPLTHSKTKTQSKDKTAMYGAVSSVQIPMRKSQILKNVFVLSLSFCFLFTAFSSMSNLQTSLNKEAGVGAWSLSTTYIGLIVSCMFLPKFIIAKLGCKWTVPVSMIGYILYMGANFYAVNGTMIPASIMMGLGAAPLWSAKCTYLTQIGMWYSKLTNQSLNSTINVFFGTFFFIFQTSNVWGNLISSLVFAPDRDNFTEDKVCGASFCPEDAKEGNNTDNFSQTTTKVYTVCGIYLGSTIIAAIVVSVFLDNIVLDKESSAEDRKLSPRFLVSTFRHLFSSPVQMLLIPITMYSGVEQGFLGGDFTKAFISCTLGVWNVGFVMIFFGLTDSVCSIIFGRLAQYIGQIPLFFLAFFLHCGLIIFALLWTPSADSEILFYIFTGLWGVGDAVIQTQLNAMYGHLFTENTEAAFANYRLWESVGFAVTYAYNDYLCTDTKLYVCLGVLMTAIVCYIIAETKSRHVRSYSADVIREQ